MTEEDSQKPQEEKEQQLTIDDDFVNEYSANTEVVKFIQKKFKRLSRIGAINLIKLILQRNINIHASRIIKQYHSFLKHNNVKFTEAGKLKDEVIKDLRISLNGFLSEIGRDIIQYDKEEHTEFEVKNIEGEEFYIIDKNTFYKKVRKLVCDEGGDVLFKYNFSQPDMDILIPQNKDTLQLSQIQILSKGVKFDYPLEFEYMCSQCGEKTRRKVYETVSTRNNIKCPGIYSYITAEGLSRSRVCGLPLAPDNEISLTKDAYYYDISYEDDEGKKYLSGGLSFDRLEPGFYECVLFKIKNPKKTEMFQIMDIKPLVSNKFDLPQTVEDENFLITLQKSIDNYIKEKTGVELYGLYVIKVALLIQVLVTFLKMRLVFNVQVSGDASTGKSLIFKYYGYLLNSHLHMTTNGLSVSVAGLRGTRNIISLMGKDIKIVTTGYLGTFKTVHIDEAGENRELIQNLKTFLLEDNYGYDKAGATGVFNTRSAQVNISENLDYTHLGQYRGTIRKAYRDTSVKIGDEEKTPWNESWDLHLPLFKYNNPYLYKIVKEKRIELAKSQKFWIDGYDYALHERFPFYFFLVNEKKDEKLGSVVKENVARKESISENLQLIRALKNDDLEEFFKTLIEYRYSDSDVESFNRVDKILENYGIHADSRMKTFYYNLVMISRITNKRLDINEQDFELLKWFLEKTNCKLDVADTVDYNIHGPPDLEKEKEKELKIEEETKELEGEFGLPEDEFDTSTG